MPGIAAGWHRRAGCADILSKGKKVRMLVEGGLQETIPAHELDLSVHRIEIDVDSRPAAALLDRQAIQPAEVHEEIRLSYQRVHASCSWAILDAMFRVDENPALAEPQPVEETGSCGD